MKPILYEGCKLFTFNLITFEFGTIEPEEVGVKKINWKGREIYLYYCLKNEKELLIANAGNLKKAVGKMITLLEIHNAT